MEAYICTICSFVYNNESAEQDAEGDLKSFQELDPEWRCPNCGGAAQTFMPADGGLESEGEGE